MRKIVLTGLSLALMLGGTAGALAAGKKHSGAHEAYASAGGRTVSDPRHNRGANHEGWCDIDPQCNGWNAWMQDVNAGTLKVGR